MAISLLEVSEHRHAAGEERYVPDVCEGDGQRAVRAEDPYRGKRRNDADPERNHVGERCDCDADGSFTHHVTHSLRNRQLHGCSAPGSKHHKRVINPNTFELKKKKK